VTATDTSKLESIAKENAAATSFNILISINKSKVNR
jgi:hypothetical protein